MILNLYATVADLKTRVWLESDDTEDNILEDLLDQASRMIEGMTSRKFFTRTETLYSDTINSSDKLILPDDLISINALATDSELDGTFDGEVWTEGEDFVLWPYTKYPKRQVRTTEYGDYGFAKNVRRYVKLTGIWGYGDKTSDPWDDSGITAQVADALATTITLSAEGTIKWGHTIRVEDEQMYVKAVTGDATKKATVVRGVNGTTAAVHTGKASYIAQYPSNIKRACLVFASRFYHQMGDEEMESAAVGSYRYKRYSPENLRKKDFRLVAVYKKSVFG